MKVIAILGSRNVKGQTASAIESLGEGLSEKGVRLEVYFLPSLKLQFCRQCEDNGWGICRSEGKCIIEDDFEMLVSRIREADAVIFAMPVYFGDLSESMKTFLDRLRRISMNENGQKGIKGKVSISVSVAGGGGSGSPSCLSNLDAVLARCGFDIRDDIAVRRQNAAFKAKVLKMTGEWLADSFIEK
jgi:multimeric flavodoxin WrbA